MAKKAKEEIENLFKQEFNKVKGDRTIGWEVEDSEQVALPLINALTSNDGKEVKIGADRMARISGAMMILPKRVVKFIKTEIEAAGAVMDDVTEERLLWLFDLAKVRHDLTEAGLLEKAGKGKKSKPKIVDVLKQ
jgi:hypothetical protein